MGDPHQPFDPLKPAGKFILKNIPPDAARAAGPDLPLALKLISIAVTSFAS